MTCVLTAMPAAYAITDCRAAFQAAQSGGDDGFVFVVILDELRVHETLVEDRRVILADTLRHRLKTNIEKLLLEEGVEIDTLDGGREQFRFVVCMGRMPVNDTDIDGDIENFMREGIVLEIWGSFDDEEAAITHAVIPVYAQGAGSRLPAGRVFRSVFDYDSESSWRRFLKKILETSLPLRAYAATGVAMDRLARHEYDLARKYFCKARATLLEAQLDAAEPLGLDDRHLLAYVDEMAVTVVEDAVRAKARGEYHGILGTAEVPAGTHCEGGG